MKKSILFFTIALLYNTLGFTQSTATDFTAVQCNFGAKYNLFSNLNDDKVVVIAWVMPCASCIPDPLNAYSIVQTYATSHPSRIHFLLTDDYGNTSCGSLMSWASNYGMSNANTFSDGAIDMSDYGEDGMPKIVILAGNNHKIYFNKNSSTAGFTTALDLALSENPLGLEKPNELNVKLSVYPIPAHDILNVSYSLTEATSVNIEVISVVGQIVKTCTDEELKTSGNYIAKIDLNNLNNGIYFLRISTAYGYKSTKFSINR